MRTLQATIRAVSIALLGVAVGALLGPAFAQGPPSTECDWQPDHVYPDYSCPPEADGESLVCVAFCQNDYDAARKWVEDMACELLEDHAAQLAIDLADCQTQFETCLAQGGGAACFQQLDACKAAANSKYVQAAFAVHQTKAAQLSAAAGIYFHCRSQCCWSWESLAVARRDVWLRAYLRRWGLDETPPASVLLCCFEQVNRYRYLYPPKLEPTPLPPM